MSQHTKSGKIFARLCNIKTLFMIKQIFSIILLSSFLNTLHAQNSSVFLKGGLNLANVSYNNNGNIDDANMLLSFHAGIQGDLPITSFLSLQPGFFVTGKGTKTQAGNTTDANYSRATTNPIYLEVPLNLVLKSPVEKDVKFFAGAGPYVAMGIAGKRKADGKIFGTSFSSRDNIEFSNDDPTTSGEEGAGFGIMKRFDYGLNGTAGFEGKQMIFSVNYGLGLAKLQSGSDSNTDDKNKHRVISISVGFRL
jgi:Outer membrane protein beta-barrel domain